MASRAPINPPLVLLIGSTVEAVFLMLFNAYIATYVHESLHASYFISSLAVGLPSIAIFLGSTFWGQIATHWRLRPLVPIGFISYLGLAIVIGTVKSPLPLVFGMSILMLGASAVAPSTIAYLTKDGGQIGWRLGVRLRWQSAGWLLGGLSGGLFAHALGVYPVFLMGWGAMMLGIAAVSLALLPKAEARPKTSERQVQGRAHFRLPLGIWPIVIGFFLIYAANEGFFVTLGLYLHSSHVPISWVGWSSSLSTMLGWAAAGFAGSVADRKGGQHLMRFVMLCYLASYTLIAIFGMPIITLIVFSLPLYPFFQIGVQRALAEMTPAHLHGKAMGIFSGVAGVGTAVGAAILGAAEQHIGPAHSPIVAAALAALGLAAFTLLAPLLAPKTKTPASLTARS